jgi:PAS domain S-box-containing protein
MLMIDSEPTNEELTTKLIKENKEYALELEAVDNRVSTMLDNTEKQVADLIISNEINALELIVLNKELVDRDNESNKRAVELIIAYRELKEMDKKLSFQKEEKEKRAAELNLANKELAFQFELKEKRSAELLIANKELIFQNKEKEKRAAELLIANKELAFQNEEKEKRTRELIKSKALLEETGRLVKLGGWEFDLITNILSWSDVVYQIHEVEPDFKPTLESALNFYTPESFPVISAALKQVIMKGEPYNLDLQLVTAKQNKIWVRSIGHAYYLNGVIVKIGGMFQDITEYKLAEETLLKMKKAINTTGEVIFLTDSEGVFTYINPAFTSLYGFTADEIIGKTTPRIFKSGVLNKTIYEDFWRTLLKGEEVRGELINKKKDGILINIEASSTPIIDEDNKIIGFLGIQRDITERKLAEKALYNSQLQLKNFAAHLQNIREEEKIAVAREIHDDLGQILVALKIEIGLFKQKIIKDDSVKSDEIVSKFDFLFGMVDKTIKTTRRIMSGLRPEIIDSLGFIEAGKSYVLEFEERNHLPCQFESKISELKINSQQAVALFRILQEALTNIAKHAHASKVKIQLTTQSDKFIMEITDNGIGFDENNKIRPDSYGMIGMKERVELLEGVLTLSGISGKGTCVRIEMPYLV